MYAGTAGECVPCDIVSVIVIDKRRGICMQLRRSVDPSFFSFAGLILVSSVTPDHI
jgi:hypothetical protein